MSRLQKYTLCVLHIYILFFDVTQCVELSMKTIYVKALEGTRIDIPCGCPSTDNPPGRENRVTWVKGESGPLIISNARSGQRARVGPKWKDSEVSLNGSSLTIPELQFPRDHGEMLCSASSEENVIVSVLAPVKSVRIIGVKLLNERLTLDVSDGQSARVTCSAQANPEPWAKWTIETGLKPTSTEPNAWTVRFPVTNDLDGKMIQCEAKNELGNGKIATAHLRVLRSPRNVTISVTPKSFTAVEGEEVIFTCLADGVPVPTYRWVFQGTDSSRGVSVSNSGVYRIKSVQASQTGSYQCLAKNRQGQARGSIKFTVLYPPKLIVTYDEKTKTLSCFAKASPLPVTFGQWRQEIEGNVLSTRPGRVQGQTTVLHLSSLTYEDTGFYVCRATTTMNGSGSGRVYVQPQTKPVFQDDQPGVYSARKNEILEISVLYYAHPPPSIVRWDKSRVDGVHQRANKQKYRQRQESANVTLSFHGTPAPLVGTAAIFSFQMLKKMDAGNYTLTLGNSRGLSIFRFSVSLVEPSLGDSRESTLGGLVTGVLIGLGAAVVLIVIIVLLFVCGVIPIPGRKSSTRRKYSPSKRKHREDMWVAVDKKPSNETFHDVALTDVVLKEDVNENLPL